MERKRLIIIHTNPENKNIEKLAEKFAEILSADIKNIEEVDYKEIDNYDLIGFGSEIVNGKNSQALLDFAKKLPIIHCFETFIFSTALITFFKKTDKDHKALRDILYEKDYFVINEFGCCGSYKSGILKIFGGINKKRPNETDLEKAEKVAIDLRDEHGRKKPFEYWR